MKLVCCDTSFLFALYGSDLHTARAHAYLRALRQPLTLSMFNQYELENALRFAGWRKLIRPDRILLLLAAFDADLKSGSLLLAPCNLALVLSEARRISTAHTLRGGHRSFDILHVASALHLGATEFLSFDTNQKKLARSEGLRLRP